MHFTAYHSFAAYTVRKSNNHWILLSVDFARSYFNTYLMDIFKLCNDYFDFDP